MSWWTRLGNSIRGERLSREIEEEMASHIEEAVKRGRDPGEARRAFGSVLRREEESRDLRIFAWLDSLRADFVFGWRQLRKRKVTSGAAILSLALAIGSCTAAFRIIDALLLRPLPVSQPEELYLLTREGVGLDGKPGVFEKWAYIAFERMQAAVKDEAELLVISYTARLEMTWKTDQEMETAYVQHISGSAFGLLGLHPAVGRLLTRDDDRKPREHPYAVLSREYWMRRFGRDPKVVGRTFRMGDDLFEVVGVLEEPFTGTEPGRIADIFVPAMMHPLITNPNAQFFRAFMRVRPEVAREPIRAKLGAAARAVEEDRVKGFRGVTQQTIEQFLNQKLLIEPAGAGISSVQQNYRRPLVALSVLVALVLLIACANIANLMAAQGAARAREMALRVSIGAGRWRLVQLVLVESAILAFLAAAGGMWFAWWSAPFVVSCVNPPDDPMRLVLPADWQVMAFAAALALGVMLLVGITPALRASAVKPVSALKGGESPHSHRRMMRVLIAVQAAFCLVVLLGAGLFVDTFERLTHKPMGFSAERLLTLEAVTQSPQPAVFWSQVAEHLRSVPGVESVAVARWPLLSGMTIASLVSVNGAPPGPVLAYYLDVSPGWIGTMKISLLEGRDFRESDTSPGEAIINQTFARQFFHDEHPLGKSFVRGTGARYRVVGVVRDVQHLGMREAIPPVAYVPFQVVDVKGVHQPVREETFVIRTASANPLALASTMRREIPRARPGLRVRNVRTEEEFIRAQTVQERLLAMLGFFFAVVALLLAGVGLYGVLDYSVVARRREIGIRMAVGARSGDIARRVTADVFGMVMVGAAAGAGLGMVAARYVEGLLYGVKAEDARMLGLPLVVIGAAALLAAVPAVVRAVRIDPAAMLRSE